MILMETKLQRFERLKITLNEIESLTISQNSLVRRYNWSVNDSENIKEKVEDCERKISNLISGESRMLEGKKGSANYRRTKGLETIQSEIKQLEDECFDLKIERVNIKRELRKKHSEYDGRTYSEFMKFKDLEKSKRKDKAVLKNKIWEMILVILYAGFVGISCFIGILFAVEDNDYFSSIVITSCFGPLIFFATASEIFPIKSKDQVLEIVSLDIENEMKGYDPLLSKHKASWFREIKISSTLKNNKKLIHSLEKEKRKLTRRFDKLRERKTSLLDDLNQKIGEINETLNSISEVESDIKKKYESISDMIPNS